MKKTVAVIALALSPFAAALAQQPETALSARLGYMGNDAGSGSDFDGSWLTELSGQLRFTPNVAVEAGYAYAAKSTDEGSDNQGSWSMGVSSSDYYAGVRLQSQNWQNWSLYGRGGLMYYRSRIKFEESFFDLKPAGHYTEIEEGTGWYLGGGASFDIAPNLLVDVGLDYRVRLDYFEDSRKSFDMKQWGGSVGLVWLLPK